MSDKTQFPMLKWAQRKDRLFITIMVVHTKKPLVEIDGKKLKYNGTDGKINYAFEIQLFGEIDKDVYTELYNKVNKLSAKVTELIENL